MPKPNDERAPCCPYCCASMRKSGTIKTKVKIVNADTKVFVPKQRWRCNKCHYGETTNSTAHNRHVRTGYGVEQPNRNLSVVNGNLAVPNKAQHEPTHTLPINSRQAQISFFTTPD